MNPTTAPLKISVLIPFKNSEETIGETLRSVYGSSVPPYEVIAVNDHSEDGSLEIVKSFPCSVVENLKNFGVSSARNLGAERASGDVLFFVDSDIVLKKDTLKNLSRRYRENDMDGVVGLLSETIVFNDFYSQYKNLWMRYTYLLIKEKHTPFYSSVASIKKASFEKTGGFPENHRKPGIEDTVFGNSLLRQGCDIKLCPDVEVEHLKKYTFFSLLRTDFKRAFGLARFFGRQEDSILSGILSLKKGKKKTTSVPFFFLLSLFVEFVFLSLSISTLFLGRFSISAIYFSLGLILVDTLNLPWITYLKNLRGFGFASMALLFLPLEIIVSVTGGLLGLLSR